MNRFKKNERGAALLEAAITVPIILLISVGIFEFGRAYQTWQVLTNAAREGARLAVIEGSTDAAVRTRVKDYLKGGGLIKSDSDLADSNIAIARDVKFTGTTTCPPCGTSITVNFPFQFMVLNPVVKLIAPSSKTGAPITMSSASLMRNE
jgi:Flp pilus assembly protein TadG